MSFGVCSSRLVFFAPPPLHLPLRAHRPQRAHIPPADSPAPSSPAPDPPMAAYPTTTPATYSSSSATILAPTPTTPSPHSPVYPIDPSLSHSPSPAAPDAPTAASAEQVLSSAENPNATPSQEVDPQILEALRSKDRIYVLKLGEQMEGLIIEHRPRLELLPTTSYQRLLVHRCSAYYKLAPEGDPVSKGIIVLPTPDSRIPARRICELVPAEATAQPAFKIMRRSAPDRRSKPHSQAGSVAGEDADLSDVEPSEAGSLGGRSNATGGSTKKRMTIEEREAAYNEARSRIFMGFEEKEKEKEKDTSASSSSLSVVSGSASTSGGGSVGDLDDTGSSPATESEWSGPVTRDKNRHGGGSAASSARSLRSGAPTFHANGSSSSRNSRAPSPSFNYPTLYEPPPSAPALYDPSQQAAQPYLPAQYLYPYPPGQPSNPPYMAPYQYYPSYHPYPSPPTHPQAVSDPSTPASGELYTSPQGPYGNPYLWPPHASQSPLQSPPQMPHHPLSPQHHQNPNNVLSPPPHATQQQQQQQQYQPQHFMAPPPPHAYTYPVPMGGYYAPSPQGQHMAPPQPHMSAAQQQQQQGMYDVQRAMNGNGVAPLNGHVGGSHMGGGRPPLGNGVMTTNGNANGRIIARGGGVGGMGNGKPRGGAAMPPQTKHAWSYGPGVGMGGYVAPPLPNGSDPVGPRLSTNRRASQNSRTSSNCDDVSSTASSSTTSSSSRTYTSTASSQHPLPPRPDWAVGLKPQPTLAGRHHDHSLTNSRTMSPISPPRTLNGSGSPHATRQAQQTPPMSLQSMDFPPLSSVAEKRIPVVAGAWGNTSSTRTILQANTPGSAAVNSHGANTRLEEPDRGFERPPPKSVQLFNPKVSPRPTSNGNSAGKPQGEKERARGDGVASAILVDEVASMSLENHGSEAASPAESPAVSTST